MSLPGVAFCGWGKSEGVAALGSGEQSAAERAWVGAEEIFDTVLDAVAVRILGEAGLIRRTGKGPDPAGVGAAAGGGDVEHEVVAGFGNGARPACRQVECGRGRASDTAGGGDEGIATGGGAAGRRRIHVMTGDQTDVVVEHAVVDLSMQMPSAFPRCALPAAAVNTRLAPADMFVVATEPVAEARTAPDGVWQFARAVLSSVGANATSCTN